MNQNVVPSVTQMQWEPVAPPDASQMQWEPAAAPAAPDPSKMQWKPAAAPAHPKVDPAKMSWVTPPTPGKTPKWLYSVGVADTLADYRTNWQSFGHGGIRPKFRDFVDSLGNAGFQMGIYDFNRGHHYAPNDPHLDGRAMDVDYINNEGVGTQLTPKLHAFIQQVIGESPNTRVGVPQQVYNALHGQYGDRMFVDNPYHVHVELTPEGVAHPQFTTAVNLPKGPAVDHATAAGVQIPIDKQMLQSWARQNAENQARLHALTSIFARVPLQRFMSALDAQRRGVGMAIAGGLEGHNPVQLIHDFWHGFTDLKTSQQATDADRALFAHIPHIGTLGWYPDRQQVKTWVAESDVPAQLKPYLEAASNTILDFGAQTMLDPTTYEGGLGIWAKAIKGSMMGIGWGARALAALDDLMRAKSASAELPALLNLFKQPIDAYLSATAAVRKVAGQVGPKIAEQFTVRPDLEDFTKGAEMSPMKKAQVGGFTPDGKRRRMAIEASEIQRSADETAVDQAAARSKTPGAALSDRYLRLMYDHGVQADSDVAAKLLSLPGKKSTGMLAGIKALQGTGNVVRDMRSLDTPTAAYDAQEALKALRQGRLRVRQYATAQRTHLLTNTPEGRTANLIPGSSPQSVKDWLGVAADPKRAAQDDSLFSRMRELQRANVMVFPFPHGVVNVGQLTYLGAPHNEALGTVMGAFRYMAGAASKGKLPGSLVPDAEKLTKYGAAQTYVHEHEAPGLWAHWPSVLGGDVGKKWITSMQGVLGHMETGWRAALWDALEHNPATKDLDPLIRGAMVAERVGDPRNVAAFVRAFEKWGGPFVAYRLGIVPRAVFKAIMEEPQRVLAAMRPVLDLQENRSQQAQHSNVFMLNDPVENAAKLMFNPLRYLLSPSTIGLISIAEELEQSQQYGQPWEQAVMNALNSINPFEAPMNVLGHLMPTTPGSDFNFMPGQKLSLTDHIAGATLAPFASFYFAKVANQKYQAQLEKRIIKGSEKFWNDFIDRLTGKGT